MSGDRRPSAAVYYLAPDHPAPSWGVGLLYHHVRLLRQGGFDAAILHHRFPFRIGWLDVEVPVRHLDAPGFAPRPGDVLVVPEVLAREAAERPLPCRRIVFVQGVFLILGPFAEAVDYPALGYEGAIAILPHGQAVVERHFGLRPALVPPFVAPYFFARPEELDGERRRRVLLVPKAGYRAAGLPDYDIVRKLVARKCRPAAAPEGPGWELLELEGLGHRDVASAMRSAAFLVNVHSHEGFNTTVPEAMASGCVALCYEAVGGRDFLVDRGNAFVFPNHDVYPLLDTLFDLMDRPDARRGELARIRSQAFATAGRFREEATAAALTGFFRALLE